MNESYFRQLKGTLDGVTATLTAKKIDRERLAFGGEGAMPTKMSADESGIKLVEQCFQPARAGGFLNSKWAGIAAV